MNTHIGDAYFTRDRDRYLPNDCARGPWGDSLSGHVVGALLGHAAEQAEGDPDLQPARLTVDLIRPVAISPITTTTIVRRAGRRIKVVDAELHQDGRLVSRASVSFVRPGEQPDGNVWAPEQTIPALPEAAWTRRNPAFELWAYGPNESAGSESEWEQDRARKFAWIREIHQLIEGVTLTPFVRASAAADVTSALTHWGTDGLRYINTDFTLSLIRQPTGEYIGLASDGHHSNSGVASGSATVFDERGPIGHSIAVALAQPATSFTPPRV